MDPTIAAGGLIGAARGFSACARGTRDIVSAGSFARRLFQLRGRYDPTWLSLQLEPSDELEGFTSDQITDIEQFMSNSRSSPILSLIAVSCLTETELGNSILDEIKPAFKNEIENWLANRNAKNWSKYSDLVFDRITHLMRGTLPSLEHDEEFLEDVKYYETFVQSPLSKSKSTSRFVDDLIRISSNIDRLYKAHSNSLRIAQMIAATPLEPIITHTDTGTGKSADFESLYVHRKFHDVSEKYFLDSSILSSGQAPFRMILTGNPGAGKSTYVQYFRTEAARIQAKPIFLIRCREYAANDWNTVSLPEFIRRRYNSEYSDDISNQDIRDILTLGMATIVLDGLDEITDPLKRVEFSKRTNALAALFPFSSILVTSREIGYDRAPLEKGIFTQIRLKEFDVEQAHLYVTKWFQLVNREELTERFMHDSESIPDIRINPLMLSLLCILYRESGAIPSRRREIYEQCADLLFHRWDRHRQIETEGSIPDFAQELMQEIAQWFYKSHTAQAGVSETIIHGMLRNILIYNSGFPRAKAERTASEFLEFCAGRAWLLGRVGTDRRGERLFSFTHTTFAEYFAAESFARASEDVASLCERILSAYRRNPSSVLPELLIQSYDKHNNMGAQRVLKFISAEAPPQLMLRLVEGTNVPAPSRQLVFDAVARSWKQGSIPEPEFLSMLQLNPIAREQFLTEYLEADTSLLQYFISAWSGAYFIGIADRFAAYWQNELFDLACRKLDSPGVRVDDATWSWFVCNGYVFDLKDVDWTTVVCESSIGTVPGIVWYGIDRLLRVKTGVEHEENITSCARIILSMLNAGAKVPVALIRKLSTVISRSNYANAVWPTADLDSQPLQPYLHLLAYITLASHEYHAEHNYLPKDSLMRLTSSVWNWRLTILASARAKGGDLTELDSDSRDAVLSILAELPDRISLWAKCEVNLLDQDPGRDDDWDEDDWG